MSNTHDIRNNQLLETKLFWYKKVLILSNHADFDKNYRNKFKMFLMNLKIITK